MYLVHYVLENKKDEYKHIHGSTIVGGKFSLNDFYDSIEDKERDKKETHFITIVGWDKI